MKNWHSTAEAAKACGLSPSTIKRWIRKGALVAKRTPGGDIRIPDEALREFISAFELAGEEPDAGQVFLVFSGDAAATALLGRVAQRYSPELRVVVADDEPGFWFNLGQLRPGAVAVANPAWAVRIRRLLAPAAVRIGLLGQASQPGQAVQAGRLPEGVEAMLAAASPGAAREFVAGLLGES